MYSEIDRIHNEDCIPSGSVITKGTPRRTATTTKRHKQNNRRISIGYNANGQGVKGTMEVKLPEELLQKIAETLALNIARKIVAESAEAIQIPETA